MFEHFSDFHNMGAQLSQLANPNALSQWLNNQGASAAQYHGMQGIGKDLHTPKKEDIDEKLLLLLED